MPLKGTASSAASPGRCVTRSLPASSGLRLPFLCCQLFKITLRPLDHCLLRILPTLHRPRLAKPLVPHMLATLPCIAYPLTPTFLTPPLPPPHLRSTYSVRAFIRPSRPARRWKQQLCSQKHATSSITHSCPSTSSS